MESTIRKLAKSVKWQNFFSATKDLGTLKLFENSSDLTKIQSIFLSYLYMYDSLYKDLMTEKISSHIMDCEIYEDAYLLYRKTKQSDNESDKQSELKLVASAKIKFPREVK